MPKQLFIPSKQNVNRYTRAGNNGKAIVCPNCTAPATVFHFSWSALTCNNCKQSINKSNYLTEVN